VNGEPDALASLRRHLERAEADLRGEGYTVDRCTTPPGALLSDQAFDAEVLILVLYGLLEVRSNESTMRLGAGDRLHVPSGVPYSLQTVGEGSVYWLHARRSDPVAPPKAEPPRKAGG
jgi:quercetin dioxygenase-like cupin family protein